MKTKNAAVVPWHSPAEVMDMIYDVREPGCEAVGYALLRPRSRQSVTTSWRCSAASWHRSNRKPMRREHRAVSPSRPVTIG